MSRIDTPPIDPAERTWKQVRDLLAEADIGARMLAFDAADGVVSLMRVIRRAAREWGSQTLAARAYVLDPADAWNREDGSAISAAAAMGLRGFAAGLLLAGALAIANGGSWRRAVVIAAVEVLWAVARFAIIRMLVSERLVARPRQMATYLAGLAPFVFGVTALLRGAAFVASALLTFRGLTAAGLPWRDARRAVAWAFAGQAGVMALGWILRGTIAILIA